MISMNAIAIRPGRWPRRGRDVSRLGAVRDAYQHFEKCATRSAVRRHRRCAGHGRKTPWSARVSGPTTIEHPPGRTVHRYYDPLTGQFLSVDPMVQQTGEPYSYAGGDPVNGSDPSGESPSFPPVDAATVVGADCSNAVKLGNDGQVFQAQAASNADSVADNGVDCGNWLAVNHNYSVVTIGIGSLTFSFTTTPAGHYFGIG